MTPKLPEPIAAYFDADSRSAEALVRCFTHDAVVKDEGRTHHGLAEIRQWKAGASAKYRYTIEPLSIDQSNGVSVVTCRLTGSFPGSPLNLRYSFRLERGKIASLEIAP